MTIVLLLLVAASPVFAADPPPEGEPAGDAGAEESSATATTSLVQSMQGESGISINTMCTNCNNADLSVAGMGGDYVELTCDGVPVSSGLGQVYLLSIMPQTAINTVTVTKGAGDAALAGGAVGGQIEIETRRPEQSFALNASADVGSYSWSGTRVDLGGRKDWFGGSFVGSLGSSDVVDSNDDDNPDLPAFDRYTLQGTADFYAGEDHTFSLGGTIYNEEQRDGAGAFDYLSWVQTGGATEWDQGEYIYNLENVDLELKQTNLRYDGVFKDGSRLDVTLSRSNRIQNIQETQRRFGPFFETYDIEETLGTATATWARQFGYRFQLRVGGSAQDQQVDIIDHLALSGELLLEEDRGERGVYADLAAVAGQKVELTIGARYVDFTYTDNEDRALWLDYPLPEGSKTLPRAALIWKPAPPYTIRFTAGTGYTAPRPIFEQVCCGRRYRGNRGILMEEGKSYGMEFTYQPSNELRIGASAFRNDFDNLIITMATLVFGGQWTYQHANVPEARLGTAAVELSWDATSWLTVGGSASWLDADNRTEDGAIPVVADFFGQPWDWTFYTDRVPYLPDTKGTIGLDFYANQRKTSISVMAQYTGDMLIQAAEPNAFDVIFSDLLSGFFATESFWVYNLRFARQLPKGLSVYAGVDNIGDYVQIDQGFPGTDYNWGPLQGRYFTLGLSYAYGR